ncbi:hypothetical protein ACM39_12625 [Chryseobacterium sp. FH2]|uniref:thiopeptide-type bacteriocin biosynthesis protein n=1 Tax=Chryseobacterium sp. FH2 TaxID=1674291 RepID=UPI00065AF0A9|nr:thiopeptide-type bacteriocin biosynthesis protein [Chryseobacterium sp. FH2]KMQ67692.1 hypothetical protein ACM39_12625 [Chryseobacterium sp. FH2]
MTKNIKTYNIIGGEWIYYKIYLGTKSADEVLTEYIKPFTEKLILNNIISEWFFIRYNDPKFHIRVRFKCTDISMIGAVIVGMHEILEPLAEDAIVWKVQLDTYNREVERYGYNTMEISEKIFFQDSIMITNYLTYFKDENLRWLFGLKAMDSFLDLFNYNLSEKKSFMENLSNGFKNEFGKSKTFNNSLSDKFRFHRQEISDIFEEKNPDNIYSLIEKKSDSITDLAKEIIDLYQSDSLTVDINSFLASHIHMLMNRLFKSKNRAHEMVCYDFLFRYYKSRIAIENQARIPANS